MSQDEWNDKPVGSADGGHTFKKPGDLIARQYEVVEVLGEGGASVVYRAKHAVLETECAIKVLLPERLPDSRSVQRFQLEAKSISRLEHPNIVAVHEFGIDDDNQPYLVMDVVDGKSLAQLVEENSFLMPKRALALFTQITEALQHAHSRSVIHRDLKPKNVIVEQVSKGNESARLIDFGIAKITEADNQNKSLTQTGEVFGSPLFMSPEQCKGLPLDQRSDIYSFGCLMYEVITGKVAARADSVLETLMLHVNGLNLDFDNAPPAVILKEGAQKKTSEAVSEYKCFNGLRRVIETCTATDPERRYQTSNALLRDFQLIARGQTPAGAKSSPINIDTKKIGRPQWAPANVAICLGIAFCALVFSAIVMLLSEGDKKPAKTEKEKRAEKGFAEIVNDLASSKAHKSARQRLPLATNPLYMKSSWFEGGAVSEGPGKKLLRAGAHGAFNSNQNDNMIVVSTSYDRAPLEKLERLGCTDYIASFQTITDSQLSNLAGRKSIDWLDLSYATGFSKNGLAKLRGSTLKKLYLNHNQIDDQWMPVVSSLPLMTLSVRGNRITDKGVEQLVRSKTLKFILLENNPISEMPPAFKQGHWRLVPDDSLNKWFTRK